MSERSREQLADDLCTLAERATRLAEALEAAEVEVGAITRDCDRLGVSDRLAESLVPLQRVPSDAAERLQDDLDQLIGELHHPPVPAANAPAHSPAFDAGPSSHEQLSVVCAACGQHVRAMLVDNRTADRRFDHRVYRCPRCGHRDRYETWDHLVEDQDDAPQR
jgi:DNA-directed RNA polymerase subunit RPC12/RpoP